MTFSTLPTPSSYTVSHQVQLILLTQYFWNPPALYCYLFLLDLQNFFSDFIEVTIFKQKSNMTFPYFGCTVLLHEFGTKLSDRFCRFVSLWPQRNYLCLLISFCGDCECVPFKSPTAWGLRWTDGPGRCALKYRSTFTLRPRFLQAPLRSDGKQKGYWADTVLGYTASLWKCFLVWKHPIGLVEHPQIHYSFRLFHSFLFFFTKARPALWSAQLPLPSLTLFHFSCNELLTYWILSWYFAS